jgi:hypothetical protein
MTTYNSGTNTWVTQVPSSFSPNSQDIFLDGLGLPVTSAITPNRSFTPMTIRGTVSSTANVSFQWQWAATVSTSFSSKNKPWESSRRMITRAITPNPDRAPFQPPGAG